MNMHNPAHPGLILKEYLEGITITKASENLGVTRATLSRIINGKAGITPDMALRLSKSLGTRVEIWLDLQNQYDLWLAKQNEPQNILPMFDPAQHSAVNTMKQSLNEFEPNFVMERN